MLFMNVPFAMLMLYSLTQDITFFAHFRLYHFLTYLSVLLQSRKPQPFHPLYYQNIVDSSRLAWNPPVPLHRHSFQLKSQGSLFSQWLQRVLLLCVSRVSHIVPYLSITGYPWCSASVILFLALNGRECFLSCVVFVLHLSHNRDLVFNCIKYQLFSFLLVISKLIFVISKCFVCLFS